MASIAVVNVKGGTGKTTTAVFLAAAVVSSGMTARVVDLDPQRSATDWAEGARAAETPLPFPVGVARAAELASAKWVEDVVIFDTPPGLPDVIDAAVDAADFVIVVTTPEPAATRQAWKLLDSIGHRNHAVLFVNGEAGRRLLDETRIAFEEDGVPVFRGYIPRREAIKRCNGVGLPDKSDLYGYKAVWKQLIQN